jgi:dihydrolipoamide dehydrogenase
MKILILGSGPAGADLALYAAKDQHEVTLIDPQFGGTCLNVGCIPTKALLEQAFHLAKLSELDEQFSVIKYSDRLYTKTQNLIDELKSNLKQQLTRVGVEIIEQSAHFINSSSIQTEDGQTITADKIIIATGAKPSIPAFFHNLPNIHTSNTLLKQSFSSAQHFAVIGAGIIGCEMASLLKMLGHSVTILETQTSILSSIPKDLAQSIHRDFKQNGIEVLTAVEFKQAHHVNNKINITFNDQERSFDQVLLATGRIPNTEAIGLENTQVRLENHRIIIDSSYQSTDPNIYAIGDVASKIQLAHYASYQAKDFYQQHFKSKNLNSKPIPNVLYTPLQAAWISDPNHIPSESDQVYKATLSALPKQKIKLNTRGSLKLVLNQENHLVHAEILSVDAAELIGVCALWMEEKVNLKTLKNVVLPHPSLIEAFTLIFHQFE